MPISKGISVGAIVRCASQVTPPSKERLKAITLAEKSFQATYSVPSGPTKGTAPMEYPGGPGNSIGAVDGEARPMVRGAGYAYAAGRGAAEGCVPCDVDIVAEADGVADVHRDHRLVVEVILAWLERELGQARPRAAAVAGAGDRQFCAVDADAVARRVERGAEEHHDEPVEDVSLRVEGERRVRAEPGVVGARQRRRQRHGGAPPATASVGREVRAHRQPEDLVRAGSERARAVRVQRDVGLALRAAFVRHVDVVKACRSGGSAPAHRSVLRKK